MDHHPPRYNRDIISLRHHPGEPKGEAIVGVRLRRRRETGPVESLVLAIDDRVVRPARRLQKTLRVCRVRREHDSEAGNVRKDAVDALAVIEAAVNVTAHRDPHNHGTGPFTE